MWFIISGLFLTYLALYLMDGHGQPALLYLVPCTLGKASKSTMFIIVPYLGLNAVPCLTHFSWILGLITVLGWIRRELHDLWHYGKCESREGLVENCWRFTNFPKGWMIPFKVLRDVLYISQRGEKCAIPTEEYLWAMDPANIVSGRCQLN